MDVVADRPRPVPGWAVVRVAEQALRLSRLEVPKRCRASNDAAPPQWERCDSDRAISARARWSQDDVAGRAVIVADTAARDRADDQGQPSNHSEHDLQEAAALED